MLSCSQRVILKGGINKYGPMYMYLSSCISGIIKVNEQSYLVEPLNLNCCN